MAAELAVRHGAGTVLLTDHDGVPCGVEVSAGSGRAVLFAAELPSNLHLFGRAFARLGATARLSLTSSVPGVFGLTSDASDAEVDQAWRRLISQYHPDRVAGAAPELQRQAEERSRELNAAYDRIKELRRK